MAVAGLAPKHAFANTRLRGFDQHQGAGCREMAVTKLCFRSV